MKIVAFSCKSYEQPFLTEANEAHGHDLTMLEEHLALTTCQAAGGARGVAVFARDDCSAPVLESLTKAGTEVLLLRSAGFNHVDVAAAHQLGLTLLRVPAYSPHAVAEHTVGLMLSLNRKIHRAYNRVREQNFSLGGLMGFDLHGKTVGVIGTGTIGACVCRIMRGFGCEVLGYDRTPNPDCVELGVEYVDFHPLLERSDIVTLHCPLTPATHHLIDARALAKLKPGAMLINTSRGGVIDTQALIAALKLGQLGSVGLDVYEEEGDLFFQNLSDTIVQDDMFIRLSTFPNVLITAHQAFFTREALTGIAETTLYNATEFERGHIVEANRVGLDLIVS